MIYQKRKWNFIKIKNKYTGHQQNFKTIWTCNSTHHYSDPQIFSAFIVQPYPKSRYFARYERILWQASPVATVQPLKLITPTPTTKLCRTLGTDRSPRTLFILCVQLTYGDQFNRPLLPSRIFTHMLVVRISDWFWEVYVRWSVYIRFAQSAPHVAVVSEVTSQIAA